MTNSGRAISRAGAVSVLGALLLAQGCSSDPTNPVNNPITGGDSPLCCSEKEFQVGGTVTIEGSAESQVAVQAIADFAGIASTVTDDLGSICRAIAQDLDAPKAEQDKAQANTDKTARMNAWCSLAVNAIGTMKASAGATIQFSVEPVKCSANVSAKANCQAKCSGSASCDVKANPPTCTGGKLEIACKGSCTAEGGATVACEGECTGSCDGSCTAQGGVECRGKCQGTCKGAAQGGTGTGIQADGTCNGTCEGTCEVTAPAVQCKGTCQGQCSASCKASASASVKCDGKCDADFEPLRCEGGKLEGGCKAEAKCEANCDASVQAKADCAPPKVELIVQASGDASAAGKLKTTLEANLPLFFALQARVDGMGSFVGALKANASGLLDIKVACLPKVVAAAAVAGEQLTASAQATVSVAGAIK
ncbi:MAG: hypothetical protein KC657_36610 [Myxococcales bacterium]|nr:hypothetical protein [Myxococcales bacterium]